METIVTKHAIKRYRERLFDFNSSDEDISALLADIATKGKKVCSRPNTWDNCAEVVFRGISIVILNNSEGRVVITCLGDKTYRKWIKRKDMCVRVCQSLRYLNDL